MKHYEFSRLAIVLNDLRKSEKAKEVMPVLEVIREILISCYHANKGRPADLSDITDEGLLEEFSKRLQAGTIQRDWIDIKDEDGDDDRATVLFIGESYDNSIIRLELENFTFEKGHLEKKEK